MMRYAKIFARFARNGLVREMSFRTNFILTVLSELFWLCMMLIFVQVIFMHTSTVSAWDNQQYLFLLGTHFIVTSVFETLFYHNVQRFSEMIRNGNLDFILLRPANTQFLVSFERIDYSSMANGVLGLFLCGYSLRQLGIVPSPVDVALFLLLIGCGVVTLYSLVFIFTSTSIWLVRQTSVQHLWFYVASCAKYPAEIYQPLVRGTLWFLLTYIIPVLLVANLPANVMVRAFDPLMVVYALVSSLLLLRLSSLIFNWALRSYRSASS